MDGAETKWASGCCCCSDMAERRRWEVVVTRTSWLRHFGVHYLLQRTLAGRSKIQMRRLLWNIWVLIFDIVKVILAGEQSQIRKDLRGVFAESIGELTRNQGGPDERG